MKKRNILFSLFFVFVSAISLFFMSCGANKQVITEFGKDNTLIAQVGYNFSVPIPDGVDSYDSVSVTDKDGIAISVKNGEVFFDKTGDYFIYYVIKDKTYISKVVVTDTESPRFDKFWDGL